MLVPATPRCPPPPSLQMSGEAVATPKQLRVVIEPLGSEQPSVMSALDPLNNDAAA